MVRRGTSEVSRVTGGVIGTCRSDGSYQDTTDKLDGLYTKEVSEHEQGRGGSPETNL